MSVVLWLSCIQIIFCVIGFLLGKDIAAGITGTLGVMGLILNGFRIDFIRDLNEINKNK